MNDHELNAALDALYAERMSTPTPEVLRRKALNVPASPPHRYRNRLPHVDAGRFGAMFGAVKVLTAGLVIVIFSGFLLFALLRGQSDREPLPAASASPSVVPSPQPVPIDLLADVALKTEVLAPGIYKVLDDGHRDLARNVRDVAASAEGDIFVVKYGVVRLPEDGDPGGYNPFYDGSRVLRVGEAGDSLRSELNHEGGLVSDLWSLQTDRDGVVLLAGGSKRFDGERWQRIDEASARICQQPAVDGECWVSAGPEPRLARFGADGQGIEHSIDGANFGLHPESRIGEQSLTTEAGVVVATVRDIGFSGLASGFGDSWSFIPYQGDELAPLSRQETLDIAPDGTLWVTNLGTSELTVASWDGQTWRSYGPVPVDAPVRADDTRAIAGVQPIFLDDGRVWFSPLAFLDGSQLHAVDLFGVIPTEAPSVESLVIGPDGSAWAVISDRRQRDAEGSVDSGLYVIRPDELTYADQKTQADPKSPA